MTIEHLLAFNIALFAAIVSPGPALLLSIQTTLRSGRSAGIAVGIGLGLMASLWTMMALLGLETIFKIMPWAYVAMKILGAAYLLYIALVMWKGARDKIEAQTAPSRNAFRQGFLVNAFNPKSVLFAAAVLVVIFPKHMTLIENAAVVFNHLMVELCFYSAVAVAMSTPAARNTYLRAKVYLDRIASLVLSALGLRLLLSR
ncbi:LysE family translocator [Hoeflea prorocentri]|uniref:LysE family translocator n=1 Tax=Hoeflea prorocentri TaxID=1922333 RepID=A0A9X3UG63_9HYPH|nr:LysE family translocator [Hoeflea prorocentri]MCY6380748.1 LysE family translocator [Hoeflea prorocentri]MDA5398548.1 LysE family translocator [Hoeflea prorocentri]